MAKAKSPEIQLPAEDTARAHRSVALLAAVGLVIGAAWPVVFAKHIGPHVPGMKKDADDDAAVAPSAASSATAAPSPTSAPTGVALSKVASVEDAAGDAAPEPKVQKQTVTVDGGTITTCWHGKEKLDGERCGTLKLDRTLLPQLRQLTSCPSALGLTGDVALTFDIDFDKKPTHVNVKKSKKAATSGSGDGDDAKGSKATELPTTTVNGLLTCVHDYLRDLQTEKIPHDHGRYLIDFGLHFRAHTDAPTVKLEEEAPAAEPTGDDVATIAWDSVILRDEPKTGKAVARLVRGTRVKILGSRKDCFEVKMGNRQGWLYRSAIGR